MESARILAYLEEASSRFGAQVVDGVISLQPQTRPAPVLDGDALEPSGGQPIPAAEMPPPQCIVEAVPADATMREPVAAGPLTLLGFRIAPAEVVGDPHR